MSVYETSDILRYATAFLVEVEEYWKIRSILLL